MLPFTTEQFFSVFADYNQSVWPMQWVLAATAVFIMLLVLSKVPAKDRGVSLLLAGLWAWMAIAYHLLRFSQINAAAYLFAALCLAEAGIFTWWAISGRPLELRIRNDASSILGITMLAYALIVYPLLGLRLGHAYPAAPTFGVPCPTTIFTFGILAIGRARGIAVLAAIPFVWAVIGGSAAYLLGVWQDLGLIASGLVTAFLLVRRHRTT